MLISHTCWSAAKLYPSNFMMKLRSNPDLFHLKTQTYTCFLFTSVITNAFHWAQICSILSEISYTISLIRMVWRTQASLCTKVNYQCLGNVSDPFFPWKINKNFTIRKRSQLINGVWCQQAADLRYPLKQGQNLEDLIGLVDTHDFDYRNSQLSGPFSSVPTILDNIIEVWLYCVFDFESPGENDLFVPLMTRMPPSKQCIAQSDRLSFEVNYLARNLGLA